MQETSNAITGLHHVGLVVRDIGAARRAYAKLGFVVPPATFPALSPTAGAEPQAFGAGNTHATFGADFLELATVVGSGPTAPAEDVRLHVISAPDAGLAQLTETIEATTARLRRALDRRQGLHILAFRAPDADRAAERLDRSGVQHGAVQRLNRPIDTVDGPRNEPIGYFELDAAGTPEGRLAVAEEAPAEILAAQRTPEHPNTAIALSAVHLAVADAELGPCAERYGRYLDQTARADGTTRVFDLRDGSRVVLVPTGAVRGGLGEGIDPHGAGFLGFTVRVQDIDAAASHLRSQRVRFRRQSDQLVVAARDAFGSVVLLEGAAGTG